MMAARLLFGFGLLAACALGSGFFFLRRPPLWHRAGQSRAPAASGP